MATKQLNRAVALTDIALKLLSTPPGLQAAPSLLLWHLVGNLPPAGDHVNLSLIAEKIGLSRVHATKSMTVLLKTGCILRGPKRGIFHHYQLNPAYFYIL